VIKVECLSVAAELCLRIRTLLMVLQVESFPDAFDIFPALKDAVYGAPDKFVVRNIMGQGGLRFTRLSLMWNNPIMFPHYG